MIRIASLLAVSAFALFTVSCGCPQQAQPPGLRKMPKFKELPSAQEIGGSPIEVAPTK
ncbi:MAG: hypothetical protein ACO3SO_02890 [Luteolibacter sp.]